MVSGALPVLRWRWFGRAPGNARTDAALNDEKGGAVPYPREVADLVAPCEEKCLQSL
jgi:hypothetical protein